MAVTIAIVLGLAAAGTQGSLTTINLKKLERFPAIQSFVKHLYAHEIQRNPLGGGSHLSPDEQKGKKSSYTNIQNVILKHDTLKNPLEYVVKLRPRHLTGSREKRVAVARCGGNKCNDNKNEEGAAIKEDFSHLLNTMQQDDKVKPVFPYWGSSEHTTLNDARDNYNDYEPRQRQYGLYDLECRCSKHYQREVLEENGQYQLRCGCSRSERMDKNGQYKLRCDCSKNYQRERRDDSGQYDLRCGCDEIESGRSHQNEKNENGRQHDLRCGCSKNYQGEGRGDSMQYDLRCGCKKRGSGRSEIMDDERHYDLRCGCSSDQLDNNGQYSLKCECDKIRPGRSYQIEEADDDDAEEQYHLECGCSNNYDSEGRDDIGQYDPRCGCSGSSQRMDNNGRYELGCGCSEKYQREGEDDNEKYDLRCGCEEIRPKRNRQKITTDSNEQHVLRCGCSRISQIERIDSKERYDLRCGCTRDIPKENTFGIQGPRNSKNEVIVLDLHDIIVKNSKEKYDNYNGKSNHVANEKDWPRVHPNSVYMGLDPGNKYFGKVNKAMKLNVNPQDLMSFYNKWKSMTTNNLVSYVLRQTDNIDLTRLSKMQRRIIKNLRDRIPHLKHVNILKLKNRLGSLLFGTESESVVLPHDEQNLNVYVPRWTHRILKDYKSNQKDFLRRSRIQRVSLLPLTKKKKLRLQKIFQKHVEADANFGSPLWRRSSPHIQQSYGVPFEMEVQALGQVNA